ncbi:hypothetical protein Cantr_07645 [Candida viswanathii]|uniref:Uncharacterized protein n=1 Tax=Candida viswanathii TaxID=5486 RepID=A0A367Y195_9ASCO|nr:hypothetical protein Cantr_07645 [Candida viswanathii]
MAFLFPDSGIAASIFLVLFVIYTSFAASIVYENGFKSIYTSLLLFGIFRVCGQFCGIAFAALGYDHYQWLVAYLVFSAEGHFTLILASFHLIANAQVAATGGSWVRPTPEQRREMKANAGTLWEKFNAYFPPSTVFHMLLIPANALIVSGGTIMLGQLPGNYNPQTVAASEGLRTAGQVIFLSQTCVSIGLAFYVHFKEGIRHCNLYSVFLVSPFITVRGIFGVLSIYIVAMNHFDVVNYTTNGTHARFVVYEYVLSTTMEYITGCIYISNYYFDTRFSKKNEEVKKDVQDAFNYEDKAEKV